MFLLLVVPLPALLSFSANLGRSTDAHRDWDWAQKVVVELGCGTAALPSCAAALHAPRAVLCTDGNARALGLAAENVRRWTEAHPRAAVPTLAQLRWGDCAEAEVLQSVGLTPPVDVILAADCIYVLENPGGWGKLLATITALSAEHTLAFVTYVDRGHDKLWRRFLTQRVHPLFRVTEVPPHLLHPVAHPGAKGRLEQLTPRQTVYSWARRPAAGAGSRE